MIYKVTDVPQPPTSSTQATTQNTATTDDSDRTIGSGSQNEKDYLKVSDDEAPSKSRGLLHVPSRSSSQKIQPSPTTTGLSGATAIDPRESIGGKSKESKSSILGRRRNGSATSSKMSITPGPSSGPAANSNTPNSKVAQPKKKSFFSMLCCGTPDDANEVNQNEAAVPANKVTKVAPRPTTASKPENTGGVQQDSILAESQSEKETLKEAETGHDRQEVTKPELSKSASSPSANGELNRPGDARDQPLPSLPKESESSTQPSQTAPAVIVQAPDPSASHDTSIPGKDGEGDTKMEESEPLPTKKEESPAPAPRKDENIRAALPPPPPVPQPIPTEELVAPETVDGKQQWLLPPIAPRFKGKKCLVLDLDETLVHSSFKVLFFSFLSHVMLHTNHNLDITPSRLYYSCGDRRTISQCLCD